MPIVAPCAFMVPTVFQRAFAERPLTGCREAHSRARGFTRRNRVNTVLHLQAGFPASLTSFGERYIGIWPHLTGLAAGNALALEAKDPCLRDLAVHALAHLNV